MVLRFHIAALIAVVCAFCLLPSAVTAQTPTQSVVAEGTEGTAPDAAAALREATSPAVIDAMLAELTDVQVREILRDEMQRQAEEALAEAPTEMVSLTDLARALSAKLERIEERVLRWIEALGNIEERGDTLREKLATATAGPWGMVAAFIVTVAAGVLAAIGAIRLLKPWRALVAAVPAATVAAPPSEAAEDGDTVPPLRPGLGSALATQGRSYMEGLLRTLLLTALDLLPIGAFSVASTVAGRVLSGPLGPLNDYGWIYQAGITNGWAFLVLLARAFSPDVPALRIASVDDDAAAAVVRLGRQVVIVGVGGWLLAGLSPSLGFGFPPAMIIVATTGLIVTSILVAAILRNRQAVGKSVRNLLPTPHPEVEAPWQNGVAAAAPAIALAYVLFAGAFWMLHWLETGRQYLQGPAGTLIVLLALPLVDRLGEELARGLTRTASPRALRFRRAFISIWHAILLGLAIGTISRLWGFNFFDLAHAEGAPAWRAAALNIVWAALITWAAWQLIRAALHQEMRTSTGAEEDDNADPAGASRLGTLMPLFRIGLAIISVTTLLLYSLAELGLNIGPLLASAGVVGIAIGFGAQTLVRDIFSGVFFLIDDAFRVGEYIELEGDLRGEVENLSIRSLQLRHHRGPVVTIPFGELKSVTNHNRDWVIYKMNFRMEPDTDPKKVKKLVKQVGAEFLASPEHGHKFIEPLKSQGVYMVDDDSALIFRVKFKCYPRQQFVLRREINHRLREVFSENDVQLARRKVEVVTDAASDVAVPAGGLPDDILNPKPAATAG